MVTATPLPTLGNIVRDTRHFVQSASVPQPWLSAAIPKLCLPNPPSLRPYLIAAGAEDRVASEMNRAYNARALELRTYYEKAISSAFAALSDSSIPPHSEKRILDTFASLYLTKVQSWIEDGVAAYENGRKQAKQVVQNDVCVSRRSSHRAFNANYIPLLEHFFDENPFPAQADKIILAKKSGMTYRQIHVWFQNRRNRTKKLDGTWKKKTVCEPRIVPLDTPRMNMEEHSTLGERISRAPLEVSRLSCSGERQSLPENRSPERPSRHTASPAGHNVLDSYSVPLHAFPAPYPPVCSYEPFPLESRGEMFSVFEWERRPTLNTVLRSPEVDIADLVDRFRLLNVRDTHSDRSQKRVVQDPPAATHSITTTPSTAPHPAVIKSVEIVSPRAHWPPFPIVRASQPTSHIFTRSTALAVPVLPAPLSKGDALSSRKVSPLPKRYPPRHSPPYRNVTPATSDASSSTPSSPCSSLCSLSDSCPGRTLSPVSHPGPPSHHISPQL